MTTPANPRMRPRPVAKAEPVQRKAREVVRGDWVLVQGTTAQDGKIVTSSFTQGVSGPHAVTFIGFGDGTTYTAPAESDVVWRGHTELLPVAPPATLAESSVSNPLWSQVEEHHAALAASELSPPEGQEVPALVVPPTPDMVAEQEPPIPTQAPPVGTTVTLAQQEAEQINAPAPPPAPEPTLADQQPPANPPA